MTLKEAKQKYNSAVSVKCLIRGQSIRVKPGTVQKGFISPKCFFMETETGVYAMVVDNYINASADIIELQDN